MNKAIIIGNLTRDIEVKYTQSNKPLPTDPNPEVSAPSNNALQTSDPYTEFANENEIDPSQFPF